MNYLKGQQVVWFRSMNSGQRLVRTEGTFLGKSKSGKQARIRLNEKQTEHSVSFNWLEPIRPLLKSAVL